MKHQIATTTQAEAIPHSELRAAALQAIASGFTPTLERVSMADHPEPAQLLHLDGFILAARGGGAERFDSRDEALEGLKIA